MHEGRDLFLNPNLNLGTRLTTGRSGVVDFTDPFGVLAGTLDPGEPEYRNTIRLITTEYGRSRYDALNLSLEKRYASNYRLRGAYTLGHSRGNTETKRALRNSRRAPI